MDLFTGCAGRTRTPTPGSKFPCATITLPRNRKYFNTYFVEKASGGYIIGLTCKKRQAYGYGCLSLWQGIFEPRKKYKGEAFLSAKIGKNRNR